MPGKVTLLVTAGPIQGRRFDFTAHDTLVFGRAPDCHAQLSQNDTSASRHHFLLEVNPPSLRLRDLGSLNGTYVNGRRCGGRERHETPEEGALHTLADVDLRNGDRLRVGATHFEVSVDAPAECAECGRAIGDAERSAAAWIAGTHLCLSCRRHGGTGRFKTATGSHRPPVPPRATSRAAAASLAPPARIVAGYEVLALLGKGGMGVVHRARRCLDGHEVAIKLVKPSVVAGPELRASVRRELEVMQRLRHPNIVEVVDTGEDGAGFFWVMEYCPAGSVGARVLLQGPFGVDAALALAREALEGLAYAHGEGFVHRDIKPDNILIGRDGKARLADFGLAKSFEQAGLSGMTATGASAGTLAFMPREQLTAFRRLQPVSDVWSLGATIYHMLTGRTTRDFDEGRDPLAVILRGRIVPLRERDPSLPAALAAAVDRAIADDPLSRYPSALEFKDALREVGG